ncbi:unnamed protein product [Spirodela intermedia]|uniref:Uncharacterized protein n=1 Tax=Spirodela intermedia TaxID=51605 RepID=A0A7I8J342_SPIIN|nr:unnamed protein product [Spirodela intermedia]CAA6664392.1 unnamed protein product [Spirodela intermedia]
MDYLPSMASLSGLYLYLLSSRHLRSFHLLALLRGCLLLVFHALFFPPPLPLPLPGHPPPPPPAAPPLGLSGDEGSTYAGRALSHLLTVVTRIPANSRKYELLRGLADRLLEENLLCGSAAAAAIGGAALAHAFSRTTRRLEAAAARLQGPGRRPDGSMEGILTGVRSRLRRWVDRPEEKAPPQAGAAAGDGDDGAEDAAEKLAAEALWLAEKMAPAAPLARRWRRGRGGGPGKGLLSSSPRLQAALVRISG